MPSVIRYPVADAVNAADPARSLLDTLPTGEAPSHTKPPSVDITLHDGARSRHAVVAGPDRAGAEALITAIVTGAVERRVVVHYLTPIAPPGPPVADVATVVTYPVIEKPFRHWWSYVTQAAVPDRHTLVVVDNADLLVLDAEHQWHQLALLSATIGVSLLLVVDRVSDHRAMRQLAGDNLLHLRTSNRLDEGDAQAYLPQANLVGLPVATGHSFGIAGTAATLPTTFVVATTARD